MSDDQEINEDRAKKMWGISDMPTSFNGKKALVLGGAFFQSGVALMAEAGFERAATVEEADVVVFMGGSDVNPALYGQKPLQGTSYAPARDDFEQSVYERCISLDKPMFGICRGAQFLHVMNKGRLWQDVNNHGGPPHLIYDIEDDVYVMATSYHHQMLRLNDDIDVIACTPDTVATIYQADGETLDLTDATEDDKVEIEIEAGAYWKTKCFFVQGHPEVGSKEYASWSMSKLEDFLKQVEENDNYDNDDIAITEAGKKALSDQALARIDQAEAAVPDQLEVELRRAGLM